jgi:hypothetical protein
MPRALCCREALLERIERRGQATRAACQRELDGASAILRATLLLLAD